MNTKTSDTTPQAEIKLSTAEHSKKRYRAYGPSLGAEWHTFSQKENPAPLYAPQSGQAPPAKQSCFEGKPVLSGETVKQPVPFGEAGVPCDPVSRPLSKTEKQAFAKIWAEIDAKAAAEEAQTAAAAAQVAADRAKAQKYGFAYPVDATQGVSFQEALPWTAGCAGPRRRGYKDVNKFRAWLERAEYSYLLTGRITRKGFELVLQGERERGRRYQKNWKRAFREAHLEALTDQDPTASTNHCLECGQSLLQPENRSSARYCSAKCRQSAYRKRQRYAKNRNGSVSVTNPEPGVTGLASRRNQDLEPVSEDPQAAKNQKQAKSCLDIFGPVFDTFGPCLRHFHPCLRHFRYGSSTASERVLIAHVINLFSHAGDLAIHHRLAQRLP
jgi:hypothetical protein